MRKTLNFIVPAVLLAAAGCAKGELDSAVAGSPALSESSPEGGARLVDNRAGQAPPVAPNEVPRRQVIRKGSLGVRVPSVEKAEDEVGRIVQASGGYVESAESSDLASATPVLDMKLRVPASQFEAVLGQLEGLGTRLSKKVGSEDVTASIVDMDARLKIMRAQEEVYRRMLSKSGSNQEMMEIQEKLMNLRGSIESLEGQRKTLGQLAALSSIQLTLTQSAEGAVMASNDPNWAREAWGSAIAAMSGGLRFVGTFAIWAAVFSPVWAPMAWFVRRAARSRQSPAGPSFDMSG